MIRATVLAQVDDNDIMNCLVRFFKERIEFKSQIEDLKRQIAEFPNKIILANQKINEALELYNKKDYKGAIKLCDEAIELNPYDYEAYKRRGECYQALGEYEQAIQNYSKDIELYPNSHWLYRRRGDFYSELGDEAKAKADFAKAKELGCPV